METRSQKRKREIETKTQQNRPSKIISTEVNEINGRKQGTKQTKRKSLVILLNRFHSEGCEKKHDHIVLNSEKNARKLQEKGDCILPIHQNDLRLNGQQNENVKQKYYRRKSLATASPIEQTKYTNRQILHEANNTIRLENEPNNRKRKRDEPMNMSPKMENARTQPIRKVKKTAHVDKQSVLKEKKAVKAKKNFELRLEERIESKAPKNQFLENEIVLATVPGYSPWPARISYISDETIFVEFFGTGQINPVRSGALQRFDLNKVYPLLQRKGYRKAIHELELVLGIPDDVSIV